MILTATTVKDDLPNVRRYVTGNLAGGADHLVLFLDAPAAPGQPEVREYLDAHPHVTCVPTDRVWWAGDRPSQLNVRQRINANLVRALGTRLPAVDWVFHIDADEIVDLDRSVLAACPPELDAVRLAPLEAVSRKHWDGPVTHFKRLLGKDDLTLLHVLGVIDKPANGAYFHGHVDGKSGIRPRLDRWLTLHHGVDADRNEVATYRDDRLRLLHYESHSGEEFVRKWTSILAAGPTPNFRPAREPTAIALQTLLAKGLSAAEAEPYLMRIFERTTEDDFETLAGLGLLERIEPGTHVPTAFTDQARFEALLSGLWETPKRCFHPGGEATEVQALLDAADGGSAPRRRGLFGRR